jgi:hypothetical protein
VQALKEHTGEIASAHIDMQGTPTEKFWPIPAQRIFRAPPPGDQLLRVVCIPEQSQPLCLRLTAELKVHCQRFR